LLKGWVVGSVWTLDLLSAPVSGTRGIAGLLDDVGSSEARLLSLVGGGNIVARLLDVGGGGIAGPMRPASEFLDHEGSGIGMVTLTLVNSAITVW